MTLDNTQIGLSVAATLNQVADLAAATAPLTYAKAKAFTSGVGAGQVDQIFADTRTVAASGTDDLDLNGTSLTNAFGASIALARIKAIIVVAAAANANNVVLGGGTNPVSTFLGGTTPTVIIKPGGMFMLVAPDASGYVVTAATADILRLANSGAGSSVTYDIIILGATA